MLAASPTSPARNPAVVVENWGETDAALSLDGAPVGRGLAFRFGLRRSLERTDLVIWFEMRREADVRIRLSSGR